MAALIAPGICRFSVNGTYAGRDIVNILDMHIATAVGTTREEAIEDQAKIIVSAWADNVMTRLVNEYAAQTVSWLDLDSADGSVGETSEGTGTDFPYDGDATGGAAPGNVALRVNKQISATRGQRQGRMYLVGLSEAETSGDTPNSISAGDATAWNTKLATFLAAINQDGLVTEPVYDSWLSVVHTVDGAYTGRSHVQTLLVDATLGSQVRRLRGRR